MPLAYQSLSSLLKKMKENATLNSAWKDAEGNIRKMELEMSEKFLVSFGVFLVKVVLKGEHNHKFR